MWSVTTRKVLEMHTNAPKPQVNLYADATVKMLSDNASQLERERNQLREEVSMLRAEIFRLKQEVELLRPFAVPLNEPDLDEAS